MWHPSLFDEVASSTMKQNRFRATASWIAVWTALLGGGSVGAQTVGDTISGLVFDEVSGEPVAGAAVELLGFATGDPIASAQTDQGGKFSVVVSPGRYWILARSTGFMASAPREVLWDEASSSVGGILLRLRSLEGSGLDLAVTFADLNKPARIIGQLTDRESRLPIPGAEIELVRSGRQTVSDRRGFFVFEEVLPGEERLVIRHLGYEEQMKALFVKAGNAYRIDGQLGPDPIQVDGIEVVATSQARFQHLDGLMRRMESGLGGTFILEHEIRARGNPSLGEALQGISSMSVQKVGWEWRVINARCATPSLANEPVIYVDGVKVHTPGSGDPMFILREVSGMDIEAIEIYRGPASVPAEFSGLDSACGAVVVWTKRGR